MTNRINSWTEEEDKILSDCIKRGGSMSSAATLIEGKSRNACIGRANRLGIGNKLTGSRGRAAIRHAAPVKAPPAPGKPKAAPPLVPTKGTPRHNPTPPAAMDEQQKTSGNYSTPEALVRERPNKVDLFGLREKTCRFPLWGNEKPEPETSFFCGEPTPVGQIYCKICRPLLIVAPIKPSKDQKRNKHLEYFKSKPRDLNF